MSQQPGWGQQPQQPYGYPQQPGPYGPPPPPQKKGIGVGGGIAIGCGGLLALVVLVGVIGALSSGNTDTKSDAKPSSVVSEPAAKPATKPKTEAPAVEAPKEQSQADQFKAFVAQNGTDAEKAAVKHVTKIQGADEQNDILDTADVYTDFKGGIMSKDASKAKLIASAFADWKHSKNGLVTIYGGDGDLISNGKF
ncbi:SPOR domain-containing protein [Streptomyces sp. NPDC017868]|uniref:SPOR domain-containing protein n=1 Tax=Streptomyces sp. NPDC017868 TaxID=3365014 RepID=UPI0037A90AD6